MFQAGSEVSALLGRIPSAVGYQPTLATDMGLLQERITSTGVGSITSVQAVYVPADDLTDPAPATTFAHLDATTVLSRQVRTTNSNHLLHGFILCFRAYTNKSYVVFLDSNLNPYFFNCWLIVDR